MSMDIPGSNPEQSPIQSSFFDIVGRLYEGLVHACQDESHLPAIRDVSIMKLNVDAKPISLSRPFKGADAILLRSLAAPNEANPFTRIHLSLSLAGGGFMLAEDQKNPEGQEYQKDQERYKQFVALAEAHYGPLDDLASGEIGHYVIYAEPKRDPFIVNDLLLKPDLPGPDIAALKQAELTHPLTDGELLDVLTVIGDAKPNLDHFKFEYCLPDDSGSEQA